MQASRGSCASWKGQIEAFARAAATVAIPSKSESKVLLLTHDAVGLRLSSCAEAFPPHSRSYVQPGCISYLSRALDRGLQTAILNPARFRRGS